MIFNMVVSWLCAFLSLYHFVPRLFPCTNVGNCIVSFAINADGFKLGFKYQVLVNIILIESHKSHHQWHYCVCVRVRYAVRTWIQHFRAVRAMPITIWTFRSAIYLHRFALIAFSFGNNFAASSRCSGACRMEKSQPSQHARKRAEFSSGQTIASTSSCRLCAMQWPPVVAAVHSPPGSESSERLIWCGWFKL